MSVISERLQDALAKGDVAELEVAIAAAHAALKDGVYRSGLHGTTTGRLTNLLAKAKDVFLHNLEGCKIYLKPLRKACRQLDECAIFDALVFTQTAPEHVQLYMYTDIRRAEELRETIVRTHEQATRLLNASDWQRIDAFLNEKASVLEDKMLLALVQRREDLLKGGARGRSVIPSLDYGAESRAGPGRSHDRAAVTAVTAHDVSAVSSSSTFLVRRESGNGAFELQASPAEDVPRATPPRFLPLTNSLLVRDSGVKGSQNTWKDMAPPPMTMVAHSLHQHPSLSVLSSFFSSVLDEEARDRTELALLESRNRVELYKTAMQQFVEAWSARHLGTSRDVAEDDTSDNDGNDLGLARCEAAVAQRDNGPHTRQNEDDDDDDLPEPRSAPPPQASVSPLEREGSQQKEARIPLSSLLLNGKSGANGRGAPEAGPRSGSPHPQGAPTRSRHSRIVRAEAAGRWKTQPVEQTQLPPRHRRVSAADAAPQEGPPRTASAGRRGLRDHVTPNVSPIKDVSTTLLSDREGAATEQVVTRLLSTTSKDGGAPGIIRPPPDVDETSVTPHQPARHDATPSGLASSSAAAAAAPLSYEARRLAVLLRSALEEEELHRRDIEGTEDFDRCVFLSPMAARIDMLKRSLLEKQRRIHW